LNYSTDNILKLVAAKGHFTIYDNNDRNYIPKESDCYVKLIRSILKCHCYYSFIITTSVLEGINEA